MEYDIPYINATKNARTVARGSDEWNRLVNTRDSFKTGLSSLPGEQLANLDGIQNWGELDAEQHKLHPEWFTGGLKFGDMVSDAMKFFPAAMGGFQGLSSIGLGSGVGAIGTAAGAAAGGSAGGLGATTGAFDFSPNVSGVLQGLSGSGNGSLLSSGLRLLGGGAAVGGPSSPTPSAGGSVAPVPGVVTEQGNSAGGVLTPGSDGVYSLRDQQGTSDSALLRNRVIGDLGVIDAKRARLSDPAYRSQRIATGLADVQQGFDAAQGQSNRNLLRIGVNPNSGKFASAQAQQGLGLATSKAQAANTERQAMDKEELGYLTAGSDMARTGLQTTASMDDATKRAALAQQQLEIQRQQGLDSSAIARYNAETSRMTGNSAIAHQQSQDNPWTTAGGALLSGYVSNGDFRNFVNNLF